MNPDRIYFKNREVAAYRLLDVLPIDSMKLEDWIIVKFLWRIRNSKNYC